MPIRLTSHSPSRRSKVFQEINAYLEFRSESSSLQDGRPDEEIYGIRRSRTQAVARSFIDITLSVQIMKSNGQGGYYWV